MKNIFTGVEINKRGRSRRSGGGGGGGRRKSRYDDYTADDTVDDTVEDTVDDTAEEPTIASSHSIGSDTYQDMEATRDKLRAYANRMGLNPEQLL